MSHGRQNIKRRVRDKTWKPGGNRRTHNNAGYPYAWLDHRKTVPDLVTGVEIPVKTAIGIDLSKIAMDSPITPRTLARKLDEQEFPKSDRLIAGFEYNDNNSPIAAYTTVKQTRLPRTFRTGEKIIFSNIPLTPEDEKQKTITQIDRDIPLLISEKINKIHRCFTECKIQSTVVTKSSLDASSKKRAKNENKRATSQNELMAASGQQKDGSASRYSNSIYSASTSYDNLDEDNLKKITHHWCHLIAHFMEGDDTQHKDNLVAATVAANNMMTVIEQGIKHEVSTHYPTEGCKLTVRASLVKVSDSNHNEHLQLATMIEMTVESKDFTVTHTIDAQDKHNPHISCVKYHSALYNALRDKSEPSARVSARRANSLFNQIGNKRTPEVEGSNKDTISTPKKLKPDSSS